MAKGKISKDERKKIDRAATAKKAETETKAKHTQTLKDLKPVANEINVRLEKADKLKDQAFDHRLSAALQLEKARQMCEKVGLKFKEWAEGNVTHSYETVRKLVTVGASKDPKQALADMREANRQANKAHRAKKTTPGSRDTASISGPAEKPEERALNSIRAVKPDVQANIIKSTADSIGLAVVTKEEAKTLANLKRGEHPATPAKPAAPVASTFDAVQVGFDGLKPSDKIKFVRYAAGVVGATVELAALGDVDGDADGDDLTKRPAALQPKAPTEEKPAGTRRRRSAQ